MGLYDADRHFQLSDNEISLIEVSSGKFEMGVVYGEQFYPLRNIRLKRKFTANPKKAAKSMYQLAKQVYRRLMRHRGNGVLGFLEEPVLSRKGGPWEMRVLFVSLPLDFDPAKIVHQDSDEWMENVRKEYGVPKGGRSGQEHE